MKLTDVFKVPAPAPSRTVAARPLRVGYVHIAKCGGTALSDALHAAFGSERMHISKLLPPGAPAVPNSLEVHSPAFHFARNCPFLSGHVTFEAMRALRRDFVFTVLREPRARLFSMFTYTVSRAHRLDALSRLPHLKSNANLTFARAVERMSPNQMFGQLVGDVVGAPRTLAMRNGAEDVEDTTIVRALKRFHVVAGGPLEHVGALIAEGIGRPVAVERGTNESDAGLIFRIGISEDEFAATLDRHTLLDQRVFRLAHEIADLQSTPMVDLHAAVSAIKARFSLEFSPA